MTNLLKRNVVFGLYLYSVHVKPWRRFSCVAKVASSTYTCVISDVVTHSVASLSEFAFSLLTIVMHPPNCDELMTS
jgi:hypothetical protein